MGFINKLLGGVFAFIGGIFGTITKLLGFGSKSEYFLEADDGKGSAPATPEPQLQTTQKVEAPTPAAKETVEFEVPTTSASMNGKVEVSQEAFAAAPEPPAPAPAEPEVKTFAPNFLVGTTPSRRRRPGPSLNPFLDMAKNMKPQG